MSKLIKNRRLKEYFIISRGQRNGMLILLVAIVITIILYFILPFIIRPDFIWDAKFDSITLQFRQLSPEPTAKPLLNPFPFDPNFASKEIFIKLGLSERAAENIIKYRDAGGKFRTADDFGKIFSISDEEFNTLRPYIQIFKEKDVLEKSEKTIPAKILNPFPFDPNLIDSTEMERLGLKDGQIRNIINYRSKGGKFKVKSDFGKLYSISEDDFSVLEKYILLPSVDTSTSIQISEEKTPIIVDLNAADTIELKQLKGIGTVFARRIVSYREKLGGYFDKSQLLEVFGMDTARLAQISPYIEVDLQKIKQLHLNKAGYKELLAHPYLENYIVKAIFEYKDKVGKFNSVDELQNISLIYPQLFQKIEHYFTVEDSYTRR